MKQVTNLIFFYKYYQIASENIQLDSSLISLLCVPFGNDLSPFFKTCNRREIPHCVSLFFT